MKVSILIPIYGVERFVERCARSLFEQTFESVEFIFVDDASQDGSAARVEAILEEYPKQAERCRIIRCEENEGVSAARNRAMKAATGHFILFVDGDDWVAPEMVEELVMAQMERNADVVTSSFFVCRGDAMESVSASPIGGRSGSLRVVLSQSFDLPNRIWGVLMRRKMLIENDIKFDESISIGEDYLFLVQTLYHSHRISHLSQPIYFYRADAGVTREYNHSARRSYIRAIAAARSFLKQQSDYSEFSDALHLSRFNLRRWLMLRKSREVTVGSAIFRIYCYSLNTLYRFYLTLQMK